MKKIALYVLVLAVVGGGIWTFYELARPDDTDRRIMHLRTLTMPAPGAARFAFLKQQVPDIVSQVTCSCCGKKLIQCYEGACPVSCGPCNTQGKKAFDMYVHGSNVEQIQRYMAKHHPVSPGVSVGM